MERAKLNLEDDLYRSKETLSGLASKIDPDMLGLYRSDLNRNEAQGKHGRGKDSRNSWSGSETGHLFLWPPLPDVEGRRNPPVLPI